MARIEGTQLPDSKRIVIALTRIYGIGQSLSKKILLKTGIDENIKVKDLEDQDLAKIRQELRDHNHLIEGDLRTKVSLDIKRIIDLGCYRGIRHSHYPCFCLCFGFLQITLTTLFLLIILQSLQIFFADAPTFIFYL